MSVDRRWLPRHTALRVLARMIEDVRLLYGHDNKRTRALIAAYTALYISADLHRMLGLILHAAPQVAEQQPMIGRYREQLDWILQGATTADLQQMSEWVREQMHRHAEQVMEDDQEGSR